MDKLINRTDLVPALIIVGMGMFSTVFSVLYLERYDQSKARAACLRRELDRQFFSQAGSSQSLSKLHQAGDAELWKKDQQIKRFGVDRLKVGLYGWAKRIAFGTHVFWIVVPMLATAIGATLAVISIITPS
jgi:hypothetical protein